MAIEPGIHRHEVIIIGGGLAGLRAAYGTVQEGLDTAVISKVHPLRSHSVAAQGGMNASLGNVSGEGGTSDSWKSHAYDTILGSDFLADQDAVETMCRQAVTAVLELEHMGTVWSRLDDGKIAQRPFGGAGFPRTCYAADRTGHNVLHTLYQHVQMKGISFYDEFFVTSLVTEKRRCIGCTAIDVGSGAVHGFLAPATLMATGGFGRIYNHSTNALINTGDGQALALRAKVPLKDMEFIQFHPTTLHGTNILITEGARGEGGILLNRKGERFMGRYAPHSRELAARDVVTRAIELEIAAGNAFEGEYIHLDLRGLGAERIEERLPGIRQIAIDFAGVDPVLSPIPVRPGQHYCMGGIDVNNEGATALPGLYAAGECACVSVHGANRLGGNSLLETIVFGRLVAESIVRNIVSAPDPQAVTMTAAMGAVENHVEEILVREGEERVIPLMNELKATMYDHFGIFRDKVRMEEGLAKIRDIHNRSRHIAVHNQEKSFNQVLLRILELEGMILLAEAVALCSLYREESRGSHTRSDFPERNDELFLRHSLVFLEGDLMSLDSSPVRMGLFELEKRVY